MNKYQKFIADINNDLINILGRKLSEKDEKLAKKLFYKRYDYKEAVSVLLTKI